MNVRFPQGESREYGQAVFAFLIAHAFSEGMVHIEHAAKFRGEVDATAALDVYIHFLQRDEVRPDTAEDPGNAPKVETTIHALAVMDVIGRHAQRGRLVRFSRLSESSGHQRHPQQYPAQPEMSLIQGHGPDFSQALTVKPALIPRRADDHSERLQVLRAGPSVVSIPGYVMSTLRTVLFAAYALVVLVAAPTFSPGSEINLPEAP
jgi:hypothetical protein